MTHLPWSTGRRKGCQLALYTQMWEEGCRKPGDHGKGWEPQGGRGRESARGDATPAAQAEAGCPCVLTPCSVSPLPQQCGPWLVLPHSFKQGCSCLYSLMLCEKPPSHVGMPGSESWLGSQFQLPANVHAGRQPVTAQGLGSLPPVWESRLEFMVPGFGLTQSRLLWAFGE